MPDGWDSHADNMHLTAAIGWKKNTRPGKPYEDGVAYNMNAKVFCVSDGVTRLQNEDGEYPNPSCAAKAAETAAKEVVRHWSLFHATSVQEALHAMAEAFAAANAKIAKLAETLPRINYLVNDLPGCVATAVALFESMIVYGHVGDTVLMHVRAGKMTRVTTDQTAGVEAWINNHRHLDRTRQLFIVRKQFRNRSGFRESYGVLTGEPNALAFVECGALFLRSGDRLFLFSDGLSSLFRRVGRNSRVRRRVWRSLKLGDVRRVLEVAESLDLKYRRPSDDKTLVSIRVG